MNRNVLLGIDYVAITVADLEVTRASANAFSGPRGCFRAVRAH